MHDISVEMLSDSEVELDQWSLATTADLTQIHFLTTSHSYNIPTLISCGPF